MLYERWRQIASEHRAERALHDLQSGRRWTFAELAREAEAEGNAAESLVCPQGHDAAFVIAVLRAWRRGSVTCPLEVGQSPPQSVCENTSLVSSLQAARVQKHAKAWTPSGDWRTALHGEGSFQTRSQVSLPPSPCVHLKTTSATTGAARLVAFTAPQLAADAKNIVATMGLRPDWPNLAAISMAHSYGFSNLVLPLLLHGIPLIIAPSPLPEVVRRAAAAEAAITLPGVPALWRTWHEAGAIPPTVRLAISAGAPLPLDLEEVVFKMRGLKIHNFYGSTECGGIAYDGSAAPRTDAACVGQPMANVSLTVEDGGCLAVRGANVGERYWPEPSPELGTGRFQTSDLAELRQGLVYLRGRASDLINVAGRKVSPGTIEQVIQQHPSVSACLVFGVPSAEAQRGETIVACVETKAEVNSDALRQFLLERLPAWQVPRQWWFMESLAANMRGKLSRAEWRNRFLRSNAGPE